MIFVILMTPIYLILRFLGWFLSGFVELMTDITEPMAEAMGEFLDNMAEFWKKIFRKNNSQYKKQ